MKKSELRQIIREEIRGTLTENEEKGGAMIGRDDGWISKGQELLKAAGHSPAEIKKITKNVERVFDAWEKKQRASFT